MTRDEVLTLVREHLAEELEVDAVGRTAALLLEGGATRRALSSESAGDGEA